MFRNDDPTAAGIMPAVAPAGTPGFWTVGNPAIGQPPTKITQDWLNITQEELINVLIAAAVTPNKAGLTQLAQSIPALATLPDVSTQANTLIVNPRVAIVGLTPGTRILVAPAFSNTGPATLNFAGNGNVPVVRPDASPAMGGDILVGQLLDLVYWGGSWIMLNPWRPAVLTQGTSYWVDAAAGNDNNPGTQAQPWATLQRVDTFLRRLNLGSQAVTINSSGAFTAPSGSPVLSVEGPYSGGKGRGSVNFLFAAGSSITGNGASCIRATESAAFTLTGPVQLTATGVGDCLTAIDGASIWFAGGPIFGTCSGGNHIHADSGANIYNGGGGYTIAGGALAHVLGTRSANIKLVSTNTPLTISLTGTPAFSNAFANCADSHMDILSNLISFSGAATGVRYLLSANGVIDTNGGAASYLPGTIAGTFVSGGQYI